MPIRFRCPKCQALMQVADEAAGQRTECPGCQSICSVPRSSGSSSSGNSPSGAASPGPQPTKPVSRPSQQQPKQPQSASSAPRPVAPKPTSPQASVPQPGSIIQVRCPSCKQLMRATAGSTVKCPHCSATVRTPGSQPSPNAKKPSPAAGGAAFSDEPLFPTGQNAPGYPPPNYGSQPAFSKPTYSQPTSNFGGGGGGFGSGQYGNPYASTGYAARGPANRTWQYITLGVIFILMSVLLFLGVISSVVVGAINIVNGAPEEFAGAHIVRIVMAFVITLPLAVVYMMGGLGFSRQSGLSAAKTVAVVACIPCFNCLILTPFGIWAAVLAFGEAGRKDFDN